MRPLPNFCPCVTPDDNCPWLLEALGGACCSHPWLYLSRSLLALGICPESAAAPGPHACLVLMPLSTPLYMWGLPSLGHSWSHHPILFMIIYRLCIHSFPIAVVKHLNKKGFVWIVVPESMMVDQRHGMVPGSQGLISGITSTRGVGGEGGGTGNGSRL